LLEGQDNDATPFLPPGSLEPISGASPHPALDRMRFLFTMSDIERPAEARLPSTFSKRQAPRKRNLFKSDRKDRAPPPHVAQPLS
jgi:hypothetical protein